MKFGISCEGKDLARLVMDCEKDITSRQQSYEVGIFVPIVNSKLKVLGNAEILSCVPRAGWMNAHMPQEANREIRREGYMKWENLNKDLNRFYPDNPFLWRVELKPRL